MACFSERHLKLCEDATMNNTSTIDHEVLEQAARRLAANAISEGYHYEGLHLYQNMDGGILYWRIRLKHSETNRKRFLPMHIDQQGNFIPREPKFLDKKPLYNLPNIVKAAGNLVYVVEGEKCVDKVAELGLTATTSGGSTSGALADWSPLRGHNVVIWPDNDDKGMRYAKEVAQCLIDLDCHVSQIDIKKLNLPEKGDIGDWLHAHPNATSEDIKKLPLINCETIDSATDEEIIGALSQLAEFAYQRERKAAAKSLGISVTALDKLVKQARAKFDDTTDNIFSVIEPWDKPVILSNLLDTLEEILHSFLVFSSRHDAKAIALWIIHTHCIDAANISPILNITSPEKRCGKSTLLAVLRRLVYRPLIASNISTAAIFRSIEKWSPTLLIDEADSFMRENEELRGVINSGHTRELAYTLRCVGDKHEPTRFSTWGAKVIAGIGRQADTIEDRSVCIQLRRKLSHEKKDQLRDAPYGLFDELLRKCVRFASDNITLLLEVKPSIPRELNDRSADNWYPLLAIATLAGASWSNSASEAGLALSGTEASSSVSVELLQDIKNIFNAKRVERIWTAELLEALYTFPEAPWSTYNRGRNLTDRQLGRKLSEFKINSKDIRFGGKIRKGYELKDFEDTFERYLSQATENA